LLVVPLTITIEDVFVSKSTTTWRSDPVHDLPRSAGPTDNPAAQVILSFDVEEHHRIEAAAGLLIDPALKKHCCERLRPTTQWLLDHLALRGVKATFFIVGQIAQHSPELIRAIALAGHEVASHSWDHQRLHRLNPDTFRADIRQSKDALEQVTGQPVLGYRAPTFSIVRQTAWALDVLAEEGLAYDSSIYPIRHDRYGIPGAPRSPFLARGRQSTILELPPVTLRVLRMNAPMGGGGYFRLFPLFMTSWAIRQTLQRTTPPVAMLYFHPWEFDSKQMRLPLGRLSRFRTYVGIGRTPDRLTALLGKYRFARAVDVAQQLAGQRLPIMNLGNEPQREPSNLQRQEGIAASAVNQS
jgi:polysaccharide deacetylase family protein (PEP-CTERM system associated)